MPEIDLARSVCEMRIAEKYCEYKEPSMKFTSLAAACAATIMFALPVAAQNADKSAGKPAAAANPVVATVNGANIMRSDIEAARGQLPEQYRKPAHGSALSADP